MKNNHTLPAYTEQELKITEDAATKNRKIQVPEYEEEEREVTFMEGVKVLSTVIFGYLLFSIIPTALLMTLADTGFFLAQGISLVLALALVFGFGLHKPASPEKIAERNRRKNR